MKLPFRLIALLLALCSMLSAPLRVSAQAPASPIAAQALLIDHDDQIDLILRFAHGDAAPTGVMLIATPGAPTVTPFPAGAQLFTYLAEATRPTLQVEPRYVIGLPPPDPPGETPPSITDVTDAGAETLTLLAYAAGDPLSLADWAALHRLPLSASDRTALAAQVAAGGGVVALIVSAPAAGAPLPAVRISYPIADPVYPHLLGRATQALDLFVLAGGRKMAPQLETYYAGPTSALDPPPPQALLPLMRSHTYLTHLHHAETATAPIALRPAADDAPLRRMQSVQQEIYLLSRSSTAVGLSLVACSSLLALVGAVALRRRLDAINPDRT